jgi:hypothetical protein
VLVEIGCRTVGDNGGKFLAQELLSFPWGTLQRYLNSRGVFGDRLGRKA